MTLGCPERPLLWVSKSLEKLAAALRDKGHRVSTNSVRRLLRRLGFSRQGNRKANEGRGHPDRDAQFEHINAQVLAFQAVGAPVISVDTKKKELIGPYKNAETDWRPEGKPCRRLSTFPRKLQSATPPGWRREPPNVRAETLIWPPKASSARKTARLSPAP
jgi:hypothetical protein